MKWDQDYIVKKHKKKNKKQKQNNHKTGKTARVFHLRDVEDMFFGLTM